MKKVLLPLLMLILASSMLMAVESAPSAIVGYVKYVNIIGNDFIALPMESGYTVASDIANAFPGMMDQIGSWDSASQTWVAATDLGGFWDGDFAVAPGMPLMVNALADFTFYSMGAMPAVPATYDFVPGNVAMMIPLNHSELTLASEVGAAVGTLDQVGSWDSTSQTWVAATDLGGFWDGDFAVAIGMPLMVNSLDTITWPGAKNVRTLKAARASK